MSLDELGCVGSAIRQAALPAPLRDLHRAVLRRFLQAGSPPTARWIAGTAAGMSLGDSAAPPSGSRPRWHDLLTFSETSTVIPAPGLAPPTKPAGPRLSWTSSSNPSTAAYLAGHMSMSKPRRDGAEKKHCQRHDIRKGRRPG
jgi:hypothetical protein